MKLIIFMCQAVIQISSYEYYSYQPNSNFYYLYRDFNGNPSNKLNKLQSYYGQPLVIPYSGPILYFKLETQLQEHDKNSKDITSHITEKTMNINGAQKTSEKAIKKEILLRIPITGINDKEYEQIGDSDKEKQQNDLNRDDQNIKQAVPKINEKNNEGDIKLEDQNDYIQIKQSVQQNEGVRQNEINKEHQRNQLKNEDQKKYDFNREYQLKNERNKSDQQSNETNNENQQSEMIFEYQQYDDFDEKYQQTNKQNKEYNQIDLEQNQTFFHSVTHNTTILDQQYLTIVKCFSSSRVKCYPYYSNFSLVDEIINSTKQSSTIQDTRRNKEPYKEPLETISHNDNEKLKNTQSSTHPVSAKETENIEAYHTDYLPLSDYEAMENMLDEGSSKINWSISLNSTIVHQNRRKLQNFKQPKFGLFPITENIAEDEVKKKLQNLEQSIFGSVPITDIGISNSEKKLQRLKQAKFSLVPITRKKSKKKMQMFKKPKFGLVPITEDIPINKNNNNLPDYKQLKFGLISIADYTSEDQIHKKLQNIELPKFNLVSIEDIGKNKIDKKELKFGLVPVTEEKAKK